MSREPRPFPRVWWDERPGAGSALCVGLLAPLGRAYGAWQRRRAAAYAAGRRTIFRPPAACVSVGNLTVGGAGKTPCVRFLAERLLALGRRPIVLSRGYGTAVAGAGLDEEGASLVAAVPGLVVDQSRGRREGRGDWTAIAADPTAVLLLDDGFQKLVCARDLDVLLVDATRPFGNGRCLPAGPLREPIAAAARADVAVLTRADQAPPGRCEELRRVLAGIAPGVPVLRARHAPARLLRSGAPPESLRGRRVALLSAVAHPAAFAATVRALGAEVVAQIARRDHAPLGAAAAAEAAAVAEKAGADLVLCTAKDWPKLSTAVASESAPPYDALDVVLEFLDDPTPLWAALRALPRGRGGA